jgi:hypothetical protein
VWKPIKSVPKYKRKGNVPDRFIVWLYDPDAQVDYRVTAAFWHNNYDRWQVVLDGNDEVIRPTHWQPFVTPSPPGTR